jgi:hypothetical protein
VDVGIVMDGLAGLVDTVLEEAIERESWSILPVAESGST